MHFVLDNIAEAIGRSRLAARKAAKSPGRRAALQTILAFGVAGTAYGLYRGTRVGIADKVVFSDLGLDKLPMNDLAFQRASLYDVSAVELIEYADIDLNLQQDDESLRYVDKETGEDLNAMLAALLDAQQDPLAASSPASSPTSSLASSLAPSSVPVPVDPTAPQLEPSATDLSAQLAALNLPQANPRLAPSDLPSQKLAPLPGLRAGQEIPAHRSIPDLVPTEPSAPTLASRPSTRSSQSRDSSGIVTLPNAIEKTITIQSTHTGERLRAKFVSKGRYDEGALAELNHILRDHRNGKVREIDRALFDTAHEIAMRTRGHDRAVLHLVSGYRSPETNRLLRSRSTGVAKNSYHVRGRAMDMFVDGARLKDVHIAALRACLGGVGYYPSSNFVHIDTGPERSWPSRYKPLADKYRA